MAGEIPRWQIGYRYWDTLDRTIIRYLTGYGLFPGKGRFPGGIDTGARLHEEAYKITRLQCRLFNIHWARRCTQCDQKSFCLIKDKLTEPPNNNLVHYRERKLVVLATDASSYALGAVLSYPAEEDIMHPVEFITRKMETNRSWATLQYGGEGGTSHCMGSEVISPVFVRSWVRGQDITGL